MNRLIRAMIIPFFMVIFPAFWYVNRNILNNRRFPHIEPSIEVTAISVGVSIVSAVVFAYIFAVFRERDVDDERQLTYGQRVFQPDETALKIFLFFIVIISIWRVIEMVEIGPSWIGDLLSVLIIPLGLPMLVLAPLAIFFHWAVILALILSVLWMSLIASKLSDTIFSQN